MNNAKLSAFIKQCESDFSSFLGVDSFPQYEVVAKEIALEKAKEQGFNSLAAAFYDVVTGTHRMEIFSILYMPQMNAEYLVFHELTHILDAETYSKRDKLKHVANKGYTEYHAAQNDFMQLLGAKSVSEPFSFSMKQSFEAVSCKKNAFDFLLLPHEHAVAMIERIDFPTNVEALAVTLGIIFNYYGRRSICKMYAKDFEDKADNTVIARLINENTVKALDAFMLGWFDQSRVALIDTLYHKMAISLAQQYKLV